MGDRPLGFFDACAGIGCFHHGMAAAGFTCVGAAERDPDIRDAYPSAFNLDPSRMFYDLHGLTKTEQWIEQLEGMKGAVLTAGFPCQPFSKGGAQLGKEHSEGNVFEALMELIDSLESPAFILENVENLTGERHFETFTQMKEIIQDKGFDFAAVKLSPHQFGIPHHRKRWFIVGLRTDGRRGFEDISLERELEAMTCKSDQIVSLWDEDLLGGLSTRDGTPITETEKESLLHWDRLLDWASEDPKLRPPSPLWGMEVKHTYEFNKLQVELGRNKNKRLTRKQLLECLKGQARRYATKYTNLEIVQKYLPPYLQDAHTRTEPYPDWKPRFAIRSRTYLRDMEKHLRSTGRSNQWNQWKQQLLSMDPTFQKLEWNVGEPVKSSTAKQPLQRIKNRLRRRQIQWRPSGIRISSGERHPALVAIGQVPAVGHLLIRPHWKILARLQSIPDSHIPHKPKDSMHLLYGSNPVKRLGNAVNANIVNSIATLVKTRLSTGHHIKLSA